MKNFFIAVLFFALSIILQYFWIKFQRREHLTQAQKTYGVNIDVEIKSKTPSMGGVIFLIMSLIALALNFSLDSLIFWSLPVASGLVGFIDDWLKFKTHTSEGFKSLSKLKCQLIICAVWIILIFIKGNLALGFNFYDFHGIIALPLAFLMTAGTINSVNITDGLDGLAAGSFLISLAVMLILLPVNEFNSEILIELFFMTAGFLFFNLRPAKTFMGDTGSHFLGGALAGLCVMNEMTLAIIPAGFIFIIEMLSSAIQIFTIRKLNKKVFLMAPLHHHYQKKGFDETAVTLRFWLVHAAGALLLALLLKSI